MTTFNRAAFKPGLSISAMLIGLLLVNATAAYAVPVRVDSFYRVGVSSFTASSKAFFDDASLTGVGSEGIQVDAYTLAFSDRGPSTGVSPDITSPGLGITARFLNGNFVRFLGSGNLSGLGLGTFTIFALEIPFSRLVVNVQFTGQRNYALESQSGLIPLTQTTGVPEPGALALFGVGLLGIAAVARRRRKAA